jgi:hypothetical protein
MTRISLLLAFFTFFIAHFLSAQVVWTEPAFPSLEDEVTIYFDATQGNGGLEDCNCDVYVHIGVLTTESNSPSDWKYVPTTWGQADPDWLMTPVSGEDDVYSYTLSPSMQEYFGIPMDDEVTDLAMVFRNGDGSQTGRDFGGTDIFYPVYPDDLPLTAAFIKPIQNFVVVEQGNELEIIGAASEVSELSLFNDGQLVTQLNGEQLQTSIPGDTPGVYEVELIADNGNEQTSSSFTYAVPVPSLVADPPAGTEPGITMIGDTAMLLALYAPNKNNVFVGGNFNNWTLDLNYQMQLSQDGNLWWLLIEDLEPGEDYFFQYLVDGQILIADPYSTLILNSVDDPFIPEETFPDLPEFPSETFGNVTWVQTTPTPYDWAVNDFEKPAKEKLTVYELLIRDFVETHDYATLIDTLDYLQNMGINAIELMPVNEFEGNISWGYNPSFHMALDKYYGPINEFKRFIDTCHARGIAVIVDVVYNHAFSQSPLVQLYFDGRPTDENPWLNRDATHPFNVGFDFNHEAEVTRDFVKRVMEYWLDEFRIDGFRFDLSKGFTQTNNPDNIGAWGAYDESRITILKDYADAVWSVTPDAYVILEHFAAVDEEKELSDYGMMLWNNIHGAYTNTGKGFGSSLNNVSYKNRGYNDPHLVSYMESHDEERIMYSALQEGNQENPWHQVKDLEVALRRIELNSVFFYPVPGPKMLWQFGEYGYDININFNGRTGPKPILWEYLDEPARKRLYDVTSELIKLRNTYEVFHTDDFSTTIGSAFPEVLEKSIRLNSPNMNVCVIGNFDVFEQSVRPQFQSTGMWYDYFTGDSIMVTDVDEEILLTASEYRLYTDVKLDEPSIGFIQVTSTRDPELVDFHPVVQPNPSNGTGIFSFELDRQAEVQIDLFNIQGQRLQSLFEGSLPAGPQQIDLQASPPAGMYILLLNAEGRTQSVKWVVE